MANLLDDTKALYAEVRAASGHARDVGWMELNRFWATGNLDEMRMVLSESKTAGEALTRIQSRYLFQINSSLPAKEYAVDWQLRQLERSGWDLFALPPDVQESAYGPPDVRVTRKGRRLTPDFFRILNAALPVVKHCQPFPDPTNVIELGAGCGHLARLLTLLIPGCHYVVVDIPETLCFSYMFLRMSFPDHRAIMVTDRAQCTDELLEHYDFVFLPAHFADELHRFRFHVFLNTASMGEMKNSAIQYWMGLTQEKLNPVYLVTVNRFLNTMIPGVHDWRLEENQCSVLYDSRWEIIKWELEPGYMRCPYILPLAARHLEIVARRLHAAPVDAAARSGRSLDEVEQQDWARLESVPAVMTARENVLVNDMTPTGTLFTLWDSIRLDCNTRNLLLMLKYLQTLLRQEGREFEETFYYEDLLERLHTERKEPDRTAALTWLHERRSGRQQRFPRLLRSVGAYNLVDAGDRVLAVSVALGPINLFQETVGFRELPPHVLIGHSAEELEQRISAIRLQEPSNVRG